MIWWEHWRLPCWNSSLAPCMYFRNVSGTLPRECDMNKWYSKGHIQGIWKSVHEIN